MSDDWDRLVFAYLLIIMAMLGAIGFYTTPGVQVAWLAIAAVAAIGAGVLLAKAVAAVWRDRREVTA